MRTPHLTQLREGLRFIARDRPLLALTGLSAVTSFTGPAFFTLLLPIYAREDMERAGPRPFSRGGWGAGALLGSLAYASLAERLPRRATFGLAYIACGMLLLPLLWAPPLAAGVAAIVASAVAFGPANPLRLTVQQERTPTALRSRVFGTTNAVAFLASPLGALAFGELAATRGAVAVIARQSGHLRRRPRDMDAARLSPHGCADAIDPVAGDGAWLNGATQADL